MKAGTILAASQVKKKVLMKLSVICSELQAEVPPAVEHTKHTREENKRPG